MDDCPEVFGGLLATQCDALEAFEPSEGLLDATACLVQGSGEEGGQVFLVGLVRDDRGNATCPCRRPDRFAGIALVGDGGTWGNVRADVEQGLEVGAVGSLAARQIESDQVSASVRFCVDSGREPALRAAEGPPLN